jgi:hypothetical protein
MMVDEKIELYLQKTLRRGKKAGMKLGAQKEREKNAAREARIAEYLRSIGVPAEKVDAALAIK